MRNIMLYEQLRELYNNYMIMKPAHNENYTYKAGDLVVTISTDKRHYGQIREGDQ